MGMVLASTMQVRTTKSAVYVCNYDQQPMSCTLDFHPEQWTELRPGHLQQGFVFVWLAQTRIHTTTVTNLVISCLIAPFTTSLSVRNAQANRKGHGISDFTTCVHCYIQGFTHARRKGACHLSSTVTSICIPCSHLLCMLMSRLYLGHEIANDMD